MDIAISVKNLSKSYKMYSSPQERVKELLHPFKKKYHRDFWALRDVSFDVKKGETIGIIGQNGSGKSTLLQILCGILQPTSGEVTVNGRISALLELGAGFNPEFTGRENVYMNGAIMGFTKEEMDAKKIPQIQEFADIGEFFDQPVKIYSSGMFVRLAFACAVNVDPDILVIDEVLAVGDEEFQRRCISKINSLQDNGTAIIFVSHALTTVEGICLKVVWLEAGKVRMEGIPEKVIDEYLYQMGKAYQIEGKRTGRRWGTKEAEIIDIDFFNGDQKKVNKVISGEEATIIMYVKFYRQIKNPIFGIIIKNDKGTVAYGTNSRWRHMTLETFEKGEEVKVIFKQKMQLTQGVYYVDPAIAYSDGITFCDWHEKALEFIVELPVQTVGIANLDTHISIIKTS